MSRNFVHLKQTIDLEASKEEWNKTFNDRNNDKDIIY